MILKFHVLSKDEFVLCIDSFFYPNIPVTCKSLKVELKNNALKAQGSMQGTYNQLSSTINGRPLWTLTFPLSGLENITIGNSPFSGDELNLGIWYLPEKKKWTLGALEDLEKGPFLQGGIVSKNIEVHNNPQNILNWDYYDREYNLYKSPNDVNDIILECIDGI